MKFLLFTFSFFILTAGCAHQAPMASFEDCVAAGNAVMESYPRQCRSADGQHFVEDIGNELEKMELIRIDSPRPNSSISSPLVVSGEARGSWFFEGDFPVTLIDDRGNILAEKYATAKEFSMVEEFVPFESHIEFTVPPGVQKGRLLLKKDNPTGEARFEDVLEVPVRFSE